jgi:2-phosphosulfolactate phosphatase
MSEDQSHHQVRFDWGRAGVAALAPAADVVVWVDVLGTAPPDPTWFLDAAVALTDLRAAAAAAAWVADGQLQAGRRLGVAVIAAGRSRRDDMAYAVEDHLGAGAVIARLGDLGLDATSPEAAVAEAAFRGLQRAVGHLVSASVSGRALGVEPGRFRVDDDLDAAALTIIRDHPRRSA